jgi:hypothetical protein
MPDEESKPELKPWEMNREQHALALGHVRKHAQKLLNGGSGCPVCGGVAWNLPPAILEIRSYTFGNALSEGVVQPLFILQCKTCNHIISFQAVDAGVLTGDEMKHGWNPEKKLNEEVVPNG